MAKRIQEVNDVFMQTAKDKVRAGQARFSSSESKPGECRGIYLNACQQIASSFESDGFRYAKSSQQLTRKCREWKHVIRFQSSPHNVAGSRIALWVHAHVLNTKIIKWREESKISHFNDLIGGDQLGNLLTPSHWFDYELADVDRREKTIEEVVTDLRQIALPYFARFENIDHLITGLINHEIPNTSIKPAIDCIRMYRDKEATAPYIEHWLSRHPEKRQKLFKLVTLYRQNGLPYALSGYAEEMAATIVEHDLDIHILEAGDRSE